MSNDPQNDQDRKFDKNEKKLLLEQYQRQNPQLQQYFSQQSQQQQQQNSYQTQLLQQQQILSQISQISPPTVMQYSGNEWTSEEMTLLHEGLKR